MSDRPQVQLLLNEERHGHRHSLSALLATAQKLECMVAFAKTSGLKMLLHELEARLSAGMVARFSVGLAFFQTEPTLLNILFKLSRRRKLELYLCHSDSTFHPKIYAIAGETNCTIIIGSANLTAGGLEGNYEASAQIFDSDGTFMQSITRYIDDLIVREELVPATKARIEEYARLYDINKVQQGLAKRRTERASTTTSVEYSTLRDILTEMKLDRSEEGFAAHKIVRTNNREAAARKIIGMAGMGRLNASDFTQQYEELILLFHSGGLHRGKNIIAQNFNRFQAALADIMDIKELAVDEAFERLRDHFRLVPRAGINVITEILHALDPNRFAVMNQNAVSGFRLANITNFPRMPTKENVNPGLYLHFCNQASTIRIGLGLTDFTELDALFNYAYWGHASNEEDDVDDTE